MMKVKDLLNAMNGDTKIAFYSKQHDFYKGQGKKRVDSVSIQKFFKIEELYKDENLLGYKVLMVTAVEKNVVIVKIKKELEND
jgi:hypothetical protein